MGIFDIIGHTNATDYDHMLGGNHYGWMVLWLLLAVILFAVIVVAIVKLTGGGSSGSDQPLDIAKERYARGEITKKEFEQIEHDIKE